MKIPYATIISGPEQQTKKVCSALIKKELCKNNSCNTCINCTLLEDKRHHQILWISPEKKYTVDLLLPVFSTIEFALEPDQHFFFIFEKADLLNASCANSLLKIVEEPPPGYHFFFLTHSLQAIIPTIRSRSHIIYTEHNKETYFHPFLYHFTEKDSSCLAFLKDLQSDPFQDHEIPEALDQLIFYWTDFYIKNLSEHKTAVSLKAQKMIALLQKTREHLPMPGSSKIFWRNMYLSINKEMMHGTN